MNENDRGMCSKSLKLLLTYHHDYLSHTESLINWQYFPSNY